MNGAHWHLLVNHLPIIFPVVGVITMFTGLIFKSDAVKRMAFLIFIIGALTAIPSMSTGEGAEETVEHIAGVTENLIENHEETAETFAILSYILGGISLLGLWLSIKQNAFAKLGYIATLVFALVVIYFARQTGATGGEIRHSEIRTGNNVSAGEHSEVENGDND
jgi:uncharacterized membrane protein